MGAVIEFAIGYQVLLHPKLETPVGSTFGKKHILGLPQWLSGKETTERGILSVYESHFSKSHENHSNTFNRGKIKQKIGFISNREAKKSKVK